METFEMFQYNNCGSNLLEKHTRKRMQTYDVMTECLETARKSKLGQFARDYFDFIGNSIFKKTEPIETNGNMNS